MEISPTVNIGAVVGGVIGAVGFIAILVLLIIGMGMTYVLQWSPQYIAFKFIMHMQYYASALVQEGYYHVYQELKVAL